MSLTQYKPYDCPIEAVQMSPATTAEIVDLLQAVAGNGAVMELQITYNQCTNTHDCSFRYLTNSMFQELTVGDYLVKTSSGEYVAMTEEAFLETYTTA